VSRRPHAARLALLTTILSSAAGCVSALREPPPITDLGGPDRPQAGEPLETLLARAETLYAVRTLDKVKEASDVWLEAARADTSRVEGLVGAVRAQVWLADHESGGASREQAATLAVQSAQWCGRIAPGSADCLFWLGAALGVQARERRTTALDALPKIVEAFKAAAAAEPDLEEAGPDRALAVLYARAPGWPTGPGDPDLSLEHARKAVELRPEFPPNHLALAEALLATGDGAGSRSEYEKSLAMSREFVLRGDRDAPEWVEEAEEALKAHRAN